MTAAVNEANDLPNSGEAKLENAVDAFTAENAEQRQDAVHKLEAYINSVEAQRGHKIGEDDADLLIGSAAAIIDKANRK